jgi:GAF domain-containing protein
MRMTGDLREQHTFDLVDLGVLTSGHDREFDAAVMLAARAARAPIATFAIIDMIGRLSRLRAHTGLGAGGPKVTEVPLDTSLAYGARASTDLIAVCNAASDPRTTAHSFFRLHGIQSLLAAPVLCPAGEVVALLAVHDTKPRIWSAEERNVLAQIAHFCTQAILLRAALKTLGLISRGGVSTGVAS